MKNFDEKWLQSKGLWLDEEECGKVSEVIKDKKQGGPRRECKGENLQHTLFCIPEDPPVPPPWWVFWRTYLPKQHDVILKRKKNKNGEDKEGGQAKIRLARKIDPKNMNGGDQEIYVMKKIAPKDPSFKKEVRANKTTFEREIIFLSRLQKLRGKMTKTDKGKTTFYIFMPLEEGVSLDEFYTQNFKGKPLTLESLSELINIFIAIAKALKELHAMGIIHRDIKPANIIWDKEKVTLIDFGISVFADEANKDLRQGTPFFISPEVNEGICNRTSSDMYSFGMLARLFLGIVSLDEEITFTAWTKYVAKEDWIKRTDEKYEIKNVLDELYDFLDVTTNDAPKNRPTAEQLEISLRRIKRQLTYQKEARSETKELLSDLANALKLYIKKEELKDNLFPVKKKRYCFFTPPPYPNELRIVKNYLECIKFGSMQNFENPIEMNMEVLRAFACDWRLSENLRQWIADTFGATSKNLPFVFSPFNKSRSALFPEKTKMQIHKLVRQPKDITEEDCNMIMTSEKSVKPPQV